MTLTVIHGNSMRRRRWLPPLNYGLIIALAVDLLLWWGIIAAFKPVIAGIVN